jgi:hypothetical protein
MSTLLTVALLAMGIVWIARRVQARNARATGGKKIYPYRCVTIRIPEDACDAVRRFENRRILCRMAPLVPLADCDYPNCSCRYQHFTDRRQDDRRELYSSMTRSYHGSNRRAGPEDRRRHQESPIIF